MAEWQTPKYGDWLLKKVEKIPDPPDNFLDGVESVVNGLETAAEVLAVVDELLSTPDIISTLISAASGEVLAIVRDLQATDIYMLPVLPLAWKALLRPFTIDDAITSIQRASQDTKDGSRPVASEATAYVQLTILGGADNWTDFLAILDAFGVFFSADYWGKWGVLASIKRNYNGYEPGLRQARQSQGTPWDWMRSRDLGTVMPVFDEFFTWVENILGEIGEFTASTARVVANLIRVIRKKLAAIRAALAKVQEFLAFLIAWKDLVPKMRVLYSYGSSGGAAKMLADITSSTNRPEFKLCSGVTLAAFGVQPVNNFNRFMDLLGLEIEGLAEAKKQIAEALEDEE